MVKDLVILGGGTAGWMAAAALSKVFSQESLSIRLIESSEIGTVGVGESSIPAIRHFNQLLGIDEEEFIRETRAIPKLAIKFSDWGKLGNNYYHPFGQVGRDINNIDFHQYWVSLKEQRDISEFSQFSIAAAMAEQGRFALPHQTDYWSATYNYAYHFDAGLYANYLRKYAEKRGVERIEGKFLHGIQDQQTGNILQLVLESGETIDADFFVDATGFRALLMGDLLKTKYESWQHWLICDRAVAVPCMAAQPLNAYTHSTAHTAGWRWRIPLQHRVGNGIVYSSAHMSKEQALDNLISNLETEPSNEPRYFSFTPGMRKNHWAHNCVAIGLSGGFLEPLESTSIYLIQYGIQKLIEYFPIDSDFTLASKEFNIQLKKEYLRIRDFIIMHYAENQRTDSSFWQDCNSMSLPEELDYRQKMFRRAGLVDQSQYGVYAAVCLGQNLMPESYDIRVNQMPVSERLALLNQIKKEQEAFIATCPSVSDWLGIK